MQLLFCSLRPPGGREKKKNEIAKAFSAVKASEKTLPFFQRRNELEGALRFAFLSPFLPTLTAKPTAAAPFCSILLHFGLVFFPSLGRLFSSPSPFSLSMTVQTPQPLENPSL